ncbi:MAG: PAS domain-containing sensor histidine kinase [Chloroflexota bacterium]
MFKQPPPRKPYSPRSDLLIILASTIIIFAFAAATNLFETVVSALQQIEYTHLDELFVTFIGLNMVFIALLVRRTRQMSREALHSQDVAHQWQQERHLLLTLIDHIPDYIFVKDREGRFVVTNIAHAKAAQALPQDLIGKTAFEVFPPNLAAQFHADDESLMQSGEPLVNAERTSIDDLGNERIVLTTKVPLKDGDGQVTGLVGISHDITHRKLREEQALELARERERVKMMTGFTKDAAHDFRTPLSTISTSVYLLLKSINADQRVRHGETIELAVKRLTQLLDGLTTMTQLDSLNELDMHVVDVNELVESVVTSHTDISNETLKPVLELDKNVPWVCGAAYELRQVIRNLIDNALLYTSADGSIVIRTFQDGDKTVLEVRDTGIGISPEDLPRIFDRFYRTDTARSSETGGIGLGLSIAKKIIELHQGQLEAESELGKGSVFRVYLPVTDIDILGASCDITPAA